MECCRNPTYSPSLELVQELNSLEDARSAQLSCRLGARRGTEVPSVVLVVSFASRRDCFLHCLLSKGRFLK